MTKSRDSAPVCPECKHEAHEKDDCTKVLLVPRVQWCPCAYFSREGVPERTGDDEARCPAETGANSATDYALWECRLPAGHFGEHKAVSPESASWTDGATIFTGDEPRRPSMTRGPA